MACVLADISKKKTQLYVQYVNWFEPCGRGRTQSTWWTNVDKDLKPLDKSTTQEEYSDADVSTWMSDLK